MIATKPFQILLAFFLLASPGFADADSVMDALKTLPVQDSGRIKPYDTFARESLHLVYGKKKFKGKGGVKRTAVDVVTTWMLIPEYWETQPILEIRHNGLREALKINEDKKILFTPREVMTNDRISLLFQELKTQRDAEEKLNPYYQAIQRLQNQLTVFHMIRTGMGLRIAPSPDAENDTWLSVAEIDGEVAESFAGITKAISAAIAEDKQSHDEQGAKTVSEAVASFQAVLRARTPEKYGDFPKVATEVWYNKVHPFMWAWIAYLISALFIVAHIVNQRMFHYRAGWGFSSSALHCTRQEWRFGPI
jgi:hypothetical protein